MVLSYLKSLGVSLWLIFYFMLIQFLTSLMLLWVLYGDISLQMQKNVATNGFILALTTIVGSVISVGIIIKKCKSHGNIASYLALHKIKLGVLMYCLFAVGLLGFFTDYIYCHFNGSTLPKYMTDLEYKDEHAWILFIAVVFFAPLWEEILFRGYIYQRLIQSNIRPSLVILFTSMTWTLIHLQYGDLEKYIIFVFGLALGVARYKTNSIFCAFAMHSLLNATSMIQLFMQK